MKRGGKKLKFITQIGGGLKTHAINNKRNHKNVHRRIHRDH